MTDEHCVQGVPNRCTEMQFGGNIKRGDIKEKTPSFVLSDMSMSETEVTRKINVKKRKGQSANSGNKSQKRKQKERKKRKGRNKLERRKKIRKE